MSKDTKQIYLSAGIEDYLGHRIANSGEDCGFEYTINGSGLSIFISEPIQLPLDLCMKFIELFKKNKMEGGGTTWKACGDNTPEFNYSDVFSKYLCDILNFHFAGTITFVPKESWDVVNSIKGNIEDDLPFKDESMYKYTLNGMVRNAIESFMNNHLSYAKNLRWPFYDKKLPTQIDSTRQIDPSLYIPFAEKGKSIGIVAGYVYPFDKFIPVSSKRHKCICHKPIFTIFSTHRLLYTFQIATQLNNIINGLSAESLYEEIGILGNVKYKFIPNIKLTKFIIQFLNLIYENKYTFEEGEFSPEKNISYVDYGFDGLNRRYHKYANINSGVYEYFSSQIYSDDNYQKNWIKYPVDRLHPIHKYGGYNSWEYTS